MNYDVFGGGGIGDGDFGVLVMILVFFVFVARGGWVMMIWCFGDCFIVFLMECG